MDATGRGNDWACVPLGLAPRNTAQQSVSAGQACAMRSSRQMAAVSKISARRQNQLLAALPTVDWERLKCHLELVEFSSGDVLHEHGVALRYVYFPTTTSVSLSYIMMDGAGAEVAIVGREGVVGSSLVMGGDTASNRALVRSAGSAYRLSRSVFISEFVRAGAMQRVMLRYVQALIAQVGQTAACNRHHSIDQRLCRWILRSLDCLSSNAIVMTQEIIATMLGVRREGVTKAASKLQQAGLIHYTRGYISVLDRAGLESRSCECYATVKRESDRLLCNRAAC
jgi:CRP-like cAMP-binding protein